MANGARSRPPRRACSATKPGSDKGTRCGDGAQLIFHAHITSQALGGIADLTDHRVCERTSAYEVDDAEGKSGRNGGCERTGRTVRRRTQWTTRHTGRLNAAAAPSAYGSRVNNV